MIDIMHAFTLKPVSKEKMDLTFHGYRGTDSTCCLSRLRNHYSMPYHAILIPLSHFISVYAVIRKYAYDRLKQSH